MKTMQLLEEIFLKTFGKNMSMFDYDFYAVAKGICRFYHENYDGSSYLEGLKSARNFLDS